MFHLNLAFFSVKYIPSLVSSQAVRAEVPRRLQRPQCKGRSFLPRWDLKESSAVGKAIWTLSIRQKGYSCLRTWAEQATETAHWICSELVSWKKTSRGGSGLCTEALVTCSPGRRLWAGLHSDPAIEQTIKMAHNSFNSGQMSTSNDFLKMQKRSFVNN